MGPGAIQGSPLTLQAGMPAPQDQGGNTRYGYSTSKLSRIVRAHKSYFDSRKTKDDRQRDEFFKDENVGEVPDRVRVNFTFAFVTVLLSILYSKAPKIQVEPREDAGGGVEFMQALAAAGLLMEQTLAAARREYSDCAEAVLAFTYEHSDSDDHIAQAIQEALITGLGVVKHSFDAELAFERTDCLQAHEIYFDPEARFNLKQCKYVSQSCVMEISAARNFFAQKIAAVKALMQPQAAPVGAPVGGAAGGQMQAGMPAPQEQNPFNLKPDFDPMKIAPNEALSDAIADPNRKDGDDGKEYLRFWEVWCNEGGERWIYYTTLDASIDFRTPWPFQLRTYDYPFSVLVFNRLGKSLNDAFSEQAVVAGLRGIYQKFADVILKIQERTIGKVVAWDGTKLTDANITDVKKAGQLRFIKVENPGDIEKLFHVVNFNQGDEVLKDVHQEVKQWIDEITGNDELIRGADDTEQMTATEAKVRDDMSRVRISRRNNIIDRFLSDVVVKRLCIARQKVNPQTVLKIAGDAAALMWELHAAEPDEFLMEFSVNVAAGSTAQRHKEEEVSNLDDVIKRMDWANQQLAATGQPPAFDVIEGVRSLIAILQRNVQRFEVKQGEPMQAGGMVPGPPASPQGVMQAVPPQGGAQPAPPGPQMVPTPGGQAMGGGQRPAVRGPQQQMPPAGVRP